MTYLTDFAAEEFAVYASSETVSDWSCGCDEMGQPVFDSAAVAEHLCREVY